MRFLCKLLVVLFNLKKQSSLMLNNFQNLYKKILKNTHWICKSWKTKCLL